MARDRDIDSASASSDGQSKLLAHALQTDSSAAQHRPKHQKQHHVGRHHHRVPSSKLLLKSHQQSQSTTRLNKRATSPSDRDAQQRPAAERRATTELKLSRDSSASNLFKNTSQTNLKRHRSSVEVNKRNKSSDKLKRASSGTAINRPSSSTQKAAKGQVHFDLGVDDADEDEWVDASGSNSPYLSRKGSINSSGQNSLRPGFSSAANSRPETPNEVRETTSNTSSESQTLVEPSAEDRERTQHQAYLTSRLLKRTASYGAPPKMTAEIAKATLPHQSPDLTDRDESITSKGPHDGLTSRFVETSTPALSNEGSFYHHTNEFSHSDEGDARRIHSSNGIAGSLRRERNGDSTPRLDNSALVPRSASRPSAPPAETSRTQQKLNLQRASSVIEPGQSVNGGSGAVGTSPWIGVGGPGFDGGTSRDPRVGRLLEKTGMEYLVVRRYQNPISRSLNRLGRLPSIKKNQKIPLGNNVIVNGKRPVDGTARHARNVSMPDPRQTAQSRRVATIRADGAGSSFDGDDMSRLSERLSDASLTGEEESDISVNLRSLWDRPVELSNSAE